MKGRTEFIINVPKKYEDVLYMAIKQEYPMDKFSFLGDALFMERTDNGDCFMSHVRGFASGFLKALEIYKHRPTIAGR